MRPGHSIVNICVQYNIYIIKNNEFLGLFKATVNKTLLYPLYHTLCINYKSLYMPTQVMQNWHSTVPIYLQIHFQTNRIQDDSEEVKCQ